jgi:DNA polymerase-3 subunit epsilon
MRTVRISRELVARLFEVLGTNAPGSYELDEIKDILTAQPEYSGQLAYINGLAAASGRPIACIDIESTGVNPTVDRIVELSVTKIYGNTVTLAGAQSKTWLINPGVLIPDSATEVHGITNEEVASAGSFAFFAHEIHHFIDECDILTFNGNAFDVPMLCQHFDEVGIEWPAIGTRQFDASVIFRKQYPRTLTAAVEEYTGAGHEGAHGALADVTGTVRVFAAQLEHDPELAKMTPDELHEYCADGRRNIDVAGKLTLNEAGEAVFTFGTHKGKRLKDEASYAQWMLRSDFPSNTKRHIMRLLGHDKK